MPSYSVNLNAVVAQAATAVTRLQVVCAYGGSDTQVCVATAANLALAGGRLRGVALENQAAGFPIQIIDYGSVNATMVGTGPYVNYDASGNLSLSTTSGTNTVGTYENGVIHVNIDFPSTGGNATSIGGVAVPSASGGVSQILAGDGTNLRGRQGVYNFRDFIYNGAPPDESGGTDCSGHLALALATIPNYGTLYIPRPTNYYRLAPSQPILYYDDDERGNKRGIHIIGEGGPSHEGGQYHFRCLMAQKTGTLASVTARTNGGSGDSHQTWQLLPTGSGVPGSGTAGSGDTGITVATKSRWIGRAFVNYNCANDENHCDSMIVDVPSNDVVRVANRNTSATNTDANNGSICWWIDEPILDMRAKDIVLQNLAFGCIGGTTFGAFIEFNHPPGSNASAVLNCKRLGCKFESDARASGFFRDGIWIARDMVATSSTSNTAWRGTNGLGELQACQPSQLDTFVVEQESITGAIRSGVAMWSATAQTKECRFVECRFGATGNLPMQYGICVPADLRSGGAWVPYGNPHFDVYRASFGFIRDAAIQLGGYGSSVFRIQGCYSENCSMALRANTNTAQIPIELLDNAWNTQQAYRHRSGQFIKTNGAGPLTIRGGWLYAGYDGHEMHIELNAAPSAYENSITLEDFWLYGRCDYSRRYGFRVSTIRGPYNLGPSGTYSLKITSDAGTSEVSITQAAMNAANFGYAVDLTRVHTWELANFIDANFTGTTAWGHGDDSYLYIRTKNLTGTGTIQVFTPGAGTDANTKIGFATTLDNAGAQTQLQKDTTFIDWTKAAGTSGKTHVITRNFKHTQVSGLAAQVQNDINKHYNSGTLGALVLEGVQGLSKTNGVTPKNFWTQITHTGGTGATFTWTFGTAEDDTNYSVFAFPISETGAPAAGARTLTAITKNLGSAVFTATDPGGAATVTWHVELRR